jgi:hypothetical protein
MSTKERKEEWRLIKRFERYKVSNNGGIYSSLSMMELKPVQQSNGYLVISLHYARNRFKIKRIHRLVAHAFLKNPHEYKEINHKDGNKTNNRVENLEWCSHRQNIQHAYDTEIIPIRDGKVFSIEDIKAIKRLLAKGELKNKEIAALYNTSADYITKIKRGDKWRRVTIEE